MLVLGGLAFLLRPAFTGPIVLLVIAMSTAVFILYDRLGASRKRTFAASSLVASMIVTALAGGGSIALLTAAGATLFLAALLTFDYSGSTPIEGGSHFEERKWRITLDPDRCEGVYRCWEVCPEACFEKLPGLRKVELAHDATHCGLGQLRRREAIVVDAVGSLLGVHDLHVQNAVDLDRDVVLGDALLRRHIDGLLLERVAVGDLVHERREDMESGVQ